MNDFMSGVICIALFAVGVISVQSLMGTDLTHDPKYNQLIQGDEPMLVQTSKVGDDVKPHIHRVWFNPVTEEYYYTVEVQR